MLVEPCFFYCILCENAHNVHANNTFKFNPLKIGSNAADVFVYTCKTFCALYCL